MRGDRVLIVRTHETILINMDMYPQRMFPWESKQKRNLLSHIKLSK